MRGTDPDGGERPERPWWRDVRGMPPSFSRNREKRFTRRDVTLIRIAIVVMVLAGIAAAIVSRVPTVLAGPVGVAAFQWWAMTPEQRNAVLHGTGE